MHKIVVIKPSVAMKAVASPGERKCGECSLCCKTHEIRFDDKSGKPSGVWCHHWKKGVGCRVYTSRPRDCVVFTCQWLNGLGAEEHRPDRTRVALDFVNLADGPEGGVLQVFEGAENALATAYVQEVTKTTLENGTYVSHIYLTGRKRFFLPSNRAFSQKTVESAREEGFEIVTPNKT